MTGIQQIVKSSQVHRYEIHSYEWFSVTCQKKGRTSEWPCHFYCYVISKSYHKWFISSISLILICIWSWLNWIVNASHLAHMQTTPIYVYSICRPCDFRHSVCACTPNLPSHIEDCIFAWCLVSVNCFYWQRCGWWLPHQYLWTTMTKSVTCVLSHPVGHFITQACISYYLCLS